ncbi:MAG: hypothetical protein LBL74_06085 [Bacteroidales bacterium]|nr:hypothetical protein [Bacteroidales bacterium]
MKNIKMKITALAMCSLVFAACEPDETTTEPDKSVENGLYVLCEGLWHQNNSTIDLFSLDNKSVQRDFFGTTNSVGLGDTGNDMIIYGSKGYVAVKESNCVIVFNKQNGKQIQRIQMSDDQTKPNMPSRLCAANGKVYVTCFSGYVVEIDTASLEMKREIKVGRNPDGITLARNKLFVSNSGGMSSVFDNTMSVIDLSIFDVTTINVGTNPTIARTTPDTNVIVMLNGDYNNIKPSLVRINSSDNSIIETYDVNVSSFALCEDKIIYLYNDYTTSTYQIKIAPYDDITASSDFIKFYNDSTSIQTPYCINVNTNRREVYLTDAKNYTTGGEVICFDYDGRMKYNFVTSINPSIVLQK